MKFFLLSWEFFTQRDIQMVNTEKVLAAAKHLLLIFFIEFN